MSYETTIDDNGNTIVKDATLTPQADADARRRRLIILAVLAAVVLALVAYFLLRKKEEPAAVNQAPAVTVITPGRTTVEGVITATGSLAARREMPVGVVGEGGRVVSVPVDAGDWVRAGQVLAVIDRSVQNEQARSTSAQIDVARADAELAQANLDRALKLVDRGFISRADVDRLTATRDAANARVLVARAQYAELIERNNRLNIIAPESGLVLTRAVEPGAVVGAGSAALFTIAKGGEMEMLAQLSESDLASLRTGVTAQVVPVGTDKAFSGQIWQLAPVINDQTRQGTARIALSYASELRPGGFATATINSGSVEAPMLPESAILSDDDGSYVYIVGPENKAVRRRVTLGIVTDSGIAIASGLNGSEQVVQRAGGFLTEGETLRPVKARRPN
ncbi:efflux RND transporter periplasmic adaptor subunit [Altererythrobacter xixiisoli]|uniref:Efflux RND transporter periplasmic adaptor subunit n=1 Tax=Croceibacterium xixiisoli TaxID=1476466 RepID=A0A6I4TR51_9SPHN|nr:efflux RND transporter periplasmic adaptor subunit [Croceibacterium xixiisoli]MXO97377.1 efflux RND transporter periplasmic adaptor subunit [Croceibacterium xixiisoli]